MKVRHKKNRHIGFSEKFNEHGLGEIIIGFDDGEMDSDYISNYDVMLTQWLPKFAKIDNWVTDEEGNKIGCWFDMKQAFANKQLITDNYNIRFAEPKTQEEYDRGWYE